MFETKMTKLLGVKYPIQCGSMQGITTAPLVAAVANAGGFCCLPAAFFPTKEALVDEIKKTRDLTDKPFGVNVGLFPAMRDLAPEDRIAWVAEAGVKILETAGRSPEAYRPLIKDKGLIHIHKCARVRDAVKVDGLGVNIVSIVGTECGGHPSMEGVTTLVLIPQTVDAIRAPLIAGGGFCDGRTLVVALALGAAAVNMGTRFMVTQECPIPQVVKDKMVATPENATVIVQQSIGNPSRVLRNAWAEKVLELEDRHATFDELTEYISGETSVRGWRAGNLEEGLVPMGQVVGRIHNIPTVAELMASLIEEAVQAKKKLDALF